MANQKNDKLPEAAQKVIMDMLALQTPTDILFQFNVIQSALIQAYHENGISSDIADACITLSQLSEVFKEINNAN